VALQDAYQVQNFHITVGVFLLFAAIAVVGLGIIRTPKRGSFPLWGWIGLGIVLSSELLAWMHTPGVSTFFTPIVWTGYLLLIDALVYSRRGSSLLARGRAEFFRLAFWSVPLWLIFEAYNARLANWAYVGLPDNLLVRGVGYAWSFATIWPAIFETAELIQALPGLQVRGNPRRGFSDSCRLFMFLCGLALVAVPVLAPVRAGRYMFGAVWVGFIFLLEPVNYRWKGQSLLRDFERGESGRLWSFLVAGLVCGIFWEFWNYWAGAKWVYVFPIAQGGKIFEMPLPGYLGFPPFALECLVMFEFVETFRRRLAQFWRGSEGALGAASRATDELIKVP